MVFEGSRDLDGSLGSADALASRARQGVKREAKGRTTSRSCPADAPGADRNSGSAPRRRTGCHQGANQVGCPDQQVISSSDRGEGEIPRHFFTSKNPQLLCETILSSASLFFLSFYKAEGTQPIEDT